MITKYLILVDEVDQSIELEKIKTTLRDEGIELEFMQFNPKHSIYYERDENASISFNIELFIQKITELPYFEFVDSIVCDYNLIEKRLNGYNVIKHLKDKNVRYNKQFVLYSANIDKVIDSILAIDETEDKFELQKRELKQLINCNIDFVEREGYEQKVIRHIRADKEYDFDKSLIELCQKFGDNEFVGLFPDYEGYKFRQIQDDLLNKTNTSIRFRQYLIEYICSLIIKINGYQ